MSMFGSSKATRSESRCSRACSSAWGTRHQPDHHGSTNRRQRRCRAYLPAAFDPNSQDRSGPSWRCSSCQAVLPSQPRRQVKASSRSASGTQALQPDQDHPEAVSHRPRPCRRWWQAIPTMGTSSSMVSVPSLRSSMGPGPGPATGLVEARTIFQNRSTHSVRGTPVRSLESMGGLGCVVAPPRVMRVRCCLRRSDNASIDCPRISSIISGSL